MTVSARLIKKKPYSNSYEAGIQKHDTTILSVEAQFMLGFIERWGMVAAMPDGEDSAGRQKLRLATTEELVARAVVVTSLAFDAAHDLGWAAEAPSMDDLVAAEKGDGSDD